MTNLTISDIGPPVPKQLSFDSRNKSSLELCHGIPPSTTARRLEYLSRARLGASGSADASRYYLRSDTVIEVGLAVGKDLPGRGESPENGR